MQWLLSQPIAHRGLHQEGIIPENSLASFMAAIQHNYAIELDINITADDQLVVFHDSNLKRMTGKEGKISEQKVTNLKDLLLLNTEQRIPLLEEVLELVNGRVPLLIEIKNEGSVGKLETILCQKLQNYQGEFAIQSFNPYSLAWFKQRAPQMIRGLLSTNFADQPLPWYQRFLLKNLLLSGVSKPHFIAYDHRFLPNLPTQIAKSIFSLPLIAWTIRTEAELTQISPYVDNIIFEYILPV